MIPPRRSGRHRKLITFTSQPQRIRERLAGLHILLTGSTGFLAKAFLEKLLRSVDSVAGIHLLVRPRSEGLSAQRRVQRDVLGSKAFDRLRASMGAEFEKLCDEKIHVIAGDLTKPRLGLDDETYEDLTGRIGLIVNSAATVTFDERLDVAIDLNSLGPSRLLGLAKDCGNAPFLHVSTCYVSGVREGAIEGDFSAPESARRLLSRIKDTDEFDLDGLLDSMRRETKTIADECGQDTEEGRRRLIEAGMSWARRLGWNDTYTFTKWIGEQLLKRDHGEVPVVIFRPAIIESSFEEPFPGWIDGLRMADPLFVAFGRGKLKEFPIRTEIPLDFIPVDFVANAMLATLPIGEGCVAPLSVYQCCSSKRNAFLFGDVVTALEEAFRRRPMVDEHGLAISPRRVRLVDREEFLKKTESKLRWLIRLRKVLEQFGKNSRRVRKLSAAARQIDQLIYFTRIYSPYTSLDCRFSDDTLCEAAARLHPDDVREFSFDVTKIDWRDYLVNRHIPGIRSFVLGTGVEPTPRILGTDSIAATYPPGGESLKASNLFEVFQLSAEKFKEKPALQIRRNGRWVRYSYDDALRATGTIMKRLQERGLEPGDRVCISGENGPEWTLTYLALMRAGLTAVPLDPQMPPDEAWAAARFVDAKLFCAGATTRPSMAEHRKEADCELVGMKEPFVPPPGASRDAAPDPVPADDMAVASILFTSGTTVAPKAVQLTHRNFIANAGALLQVHPVYPTDEFLSVLPMYHAFEFTGGFVIPLASGATITYVAQLKRPDIVSAMKTTGTTVMLVVPRLLQTFHDSIQNRLASEGAATRAMFRVLKFVSTATGHKYARHFFSRIHQGFGGRLRIIVSGGSRLDAELCDAFSRLGFMVCEGYGLTETSPILTVNPPHAVRSGSVGRPLPNVELEIRNQNLEGIGEIWARAPSIMSGYLNNAEATREVLADGWFRTGDLGRLDSDGFLHITGRSKDLIVTSAGQNVYPDEVEFRHKDLPYVKELCVLAMPAVEGTGDAVHAVVVIEPDAAPELDRSSIEREIRLAAAGIGESLPSHQRIASFHFWDRELPKTTTLKAKRGVVRELLLAEGPRRLGECGVPTKAAPDEETTRSTLRSEDTPGWEAVRQILATHSSLAAESINPEMNLLLDLGIDSIGKIDVIGHVEARFSMRIDNEQAAKVARVVDLVNLVGKREPAVRAKRDATAWQRRLTTPDSAGWINGQLPAPMKPIRWAVRGGVGTFMTSYVRVQSFGRQNIPRTGPFLLAPNHSSHLDSPSVLTAVGNLRRVWIAGAEDYFFNTRIKRFIFSKLLDTIPFDRQADGLAGLRRCGEALNRGDGLLIFPEGTRSVTGEMQPFKIGIAVLAIERAVPIVPVHIGHASDLLSKGDVFVKPGRITVSFGRPIQPPPREQVEDHYKAFIELIEGVQGAVVDLMRKKD